MFLKMTNFYQKFVEKGLEFVKVWTKHFETFKVIIWIQKVFTTTCSCLVKSYDCNDVDPITDALASEKSDLEIKIRHKVRHWICKSLKLIYLKNFTKQPYELLARHMNNVEIAKSPFLFIFKKDYFCLKPNKVYSLW